MKKALCVICAVVIIIGMFGACKKNKYDDDEYEDYSSGSSSSSGSSFEMDASIYCLLYMQVSNVNVRHERNYTYCTGTVKNTGTYSIRYVKVKASLKDYKGDIIDTDWTYAVDSSWLGPGESKSFEMMIRDPDGKIKSATVTAYVD